MKYTENVMKEKSNNSGIWQKIIKIISCSLLMLSLGMFIYHDQTTYDVYQKLTRLNETQGLSEKEEWNLILVNDNTMIPNKFEVSLMTLKDGSRIDERIYEDLQNMFDDARANGLSPMINSAYRTTKEQQLLYDEKINQYIGQGFSRKEAKLKASGWVATPGFSEHQTGLALDIIGQNGSSPIVQQWLKENSYKYGFILRYPSGKEHITGINYEPWHFRYVGIEAALEMYTSQLTLEEYLGSQL